MRVLTSDLVPLPILSATQAITLAKQLETHSEGHKLSPEASASLKELTAALRALEKANTARMMEASSSSAAAVEADHVIDRAWGAVSQLVNGWVQVDDRKLSPLAKEIADAVFASGTEFLKAKYNEEWAESEARLQAIAQKKLEGHFDKLGASVFLTTLKRAHSAYGKALGVTAKDVQPPAPKVKEALDEVTGAMREYVTKVIAMGSRKKKSSMDTVDALLLPLTHWQSTRAAPVDAPVPPPPVPVVPQPPT